MRECKMPGRRLTAMLSTLDGQRTPGLSRLVPGNTFEERYRQAKLSREA